jgi:hypothetical protein
MTEIQARHLKREHEHLPVSDCLMLTDELSKWFHTNIREKSIDAAHTTATTTILFPTVGSKFIHVIFCGCAGGLRHSHINWIKHRTFFYLFLYLEFLSTELRELEAINPLLEKSWALNFFFIVN